MSHFAEISGSTVIRVIVAEQGFINSGAVGNSSNWIQTSYNTFGGVHYGLDATGSYVADGGTQLRKNYAGIGYTYNTSRDAFYEPQPQNFVSSSLTFYKMDDDPPPSYIRNYFTQNPSGSIPYLLNEDSCLWELSGSSG